jgi:hypothetical protein
MGAWDDLTLTGAALRGVSFVDFGTTVNTVTTGDDKLTSAKASVRNLLTAPLARYIAQATTAEAFFDLIAADTAIDRELAQVIALAYAYWYYFDKFTVEGDQNYVRAKEYERRLKEAANALSLIIPDAIGLETGGANIARSTALNTVTRWWPQG